MVTTMDSGVTQSPPGNQSVCESVWSKAAVESNIPQLAERLLPAANLLDPEPAHSYNLKDERPVRREKSDSQQPKLARELELALRAHMQCGGATPWQKPRS